MPSLIYDSCLYQVFRSMIHFDIDEFKIMLVTSEYVPDKGNDKKRSDVYGEVTANNSGYQKGGLPVKVSVTRGNNSVDILLAGAVWDNATITASGAVYYKARGFPIEDDLVCYIEFGATSSSNGKFTVTESAIKIQN